MRNSTDTTLDTSKWMTRYFWGEKGMDSSFALEDDKSFPTDGENIEFYDNKARIVTKAGNAEGLYGGGTRDLSRKILILPRV